MGNTSKKLLALIAACACAASTVAFASCGKGDYKGDDLGAGFDKAAAVSSNGGFAVEKGDYVYFVNGAEAYTAGNVYGEVLKGALLRVSKTDLAAGNFTNDTVKTVVPSLFVSQNFNAGIFIYEDYVYYATPTTDKNLDGVVENSYVDFKRAKIDGSEAPMDGYFFRLSSNSANYRFVQGADGTVYCMYEEDGALKSFNTSTKTTATLVSGSGVSYFYDQENLTNPNVYYTMGVTADADSDYASTASYNQLYKVNAAATVEKVDENAASYTVKGGKTYDFDENWLKEQNKKAKDEKKDEPYNLADYTTYPYVNLGELVLDGIGKNSVKKTQFNETTEAVPETTDGYTYTVKKYANDGVYFTRTEIAKTESEGENTKLYYLADAENDAQAWDAVSGNKAEKLDIVAANTANTDSALFYLKDNAHWYVYLADGKLYKQTYGAEAIELTSKASSATLWQIRGNYLYYYATNGSGSGNNLSRIDYTGAKADYNPLLVNQKTAYQPITVSYVDWNSAWYKPEIIGETLLYSNAKAFGDISYNYIYAAKLGADNAALTALNEKYNAVQEHIDEFSDNADLQTAMRYYFNSGSRKAFDDVKESEYDSYQIEKFDEFVALFEGEGKFVGSKLGAFTSLVSKMTKADTEAIDEAWAKTLRQPNEETDEETEWPVWATVLIIVGSALIVGTGVAIPLVIAANKKKAAKAEAEATVNAYKRKIDTTDDKSIDVYSDEAETVEETVEETAEETAEKAVQETEETTEEIAETPAEEEKKEE